MLLADVNYAMKHLQVGATIPCGDSRREEEMHSLAYLTRQPRDS